MTDQRPTCMQVPVSRWLGTDVVIALVRQARRLFPGGSAIANRGHCCSASKEPPDGPLTSGICDKPPSMQLTRTNVLLSSRRSFVRTHSIPHTLRLAIRAMSYINKPVPGIDQYISLNEPAIGTAYPEVGFAAANTECHGLTSCARTVGVPSECQPPSVIQAHHHSRHDVQEQDLRGTSNPLRTAWSTSNSHTNQYSRRCASTAQTMGMRRIGTLCTSA